MREHLRKSAAGRLHLGALALCAVLLFTGCGRGSAAPRQPETPEATAQELFERHLDCMLHVMELGELPHQAPAEGSSIAPVTDERFPDYQSFADYLHSIYSGELADRLLKDYPYEGEPKYLEQGGRLCLDLNLCGGKGYYADWSDYTVEITNSSDTVCDFTAIATVTWPAENPRPEEYRVDAQMVRTADGWRMNTWSY